MTDSPRFHEILEQLADQRKRLERIATNFEKLEAELERLEAMMPEPAEFSGERLAQQHPK